MNQERLDWREGCGTRRERSRNSAGKMCLDDAPMTFERAQALERAPHEATSLEVGTLFVLAIACAALVGYATASFGPAGWHFAMNNVAAAENLLRGDGVFQSRGAPFLSWPPLLPGMLALLRATGMRYVDATWFIAVLSTFVVTFFYGRSLLGLSGRLLVAVAGVAIMFATPSFFEIMTATLSQPLFMALVAASIWYTMRWLVAPSRALELGLGALGMLACLHRYDAVILVGVTTCVLWRGTSALSEARRLVRPVLYSCASCLPMFLWLLRNRGVSGTWTGERVPSSIGFADQWRDVASTAGRWILPTFEPAIRSGTGFGSVHAVSAGALALFSGTFLAIKCVRRERAVWLAFAAFPLVYGFALMALASRVEMDTLGERLAVPVMPYLVALFLIALADVTYWPPRWRTLGVWVSRVAVASFVFVHLAANGGRLRDSIESKRADGAGGLASEKWIDSDLARWLREHEIDGPLFTNSPETVLFGADRGSELVTYETWRDVLSADSGTKTVAWTTVRRRDRRILSEIRSTFELEALAEFESGVVFRVLPRAK